MCFNVDLSADLSDYLTDLSAPKSNKPTSQQTTSIRPANGSQVVDDDDNDDDGDPPNRPSKNVNKARSHNNASMYR